MRTHFKYIIQSLSLVSRCYRKGFVLKVIYVFMLSVLPLANLVLLKMLVDAVVAGGSQALATAMPLAAGFCGVFLLQRLIGVLNGINNDVMSQRLQDYISDRLQHQAVRLDMAYYDNPEYHDTFHRAQQEASYRPINLLNNIMSILGALISLAGVVAIMAAASWWILVVMIAAVVPSLIVRTKKVRSIYKFRRENTQPYRRTNYYSTVLTHRNFAKEVRTFALADYFRSRFVETRSKLVATLLRISRRIGCYDAISAVVEVAALAAIIIGLVKSSVTGHMTVGTFVMVFEAFRRGQTYLRSLVDGVAGIYENRLFISNIFEFLELKPSIVAPAEPLPFPQQVKSVEWRDITFRYPDMQADVLQHFSLKAQLGDVTQIEGENGFGKTTLLKLLLRLYDPQEGVVLINGIDIRRFDPLQLRQHIGAIFQDYDQFCCTARENIMFGDLLSQPDEQRMKWAAQKSGADKVIEKLPEGYDTLLGRQFDTGQELSMGQWQRIALARLLYSDAPIMLLDEPMAWMDRETRETLMQTIEELKQDHLIILIRHI